jgi:hypothetical protein
VKTAQGTSKPLHSAKEGRPRRHELGNCTEQAKRQDPKVSRSQGRAGRADAEGAGFPFGVMESSEVDGGNGCWK